MIFERKMIHLKDGRTCVLRPVEAEDSKAMIECLRIVSSETPFLLRNEDEVTMTIEAEEQFLKAKSEDPHEIMMAAEVDGELSGNCAIMSVGSLPSVRICDITEKSLLGTWYRIRIDGVRIYSGEGNGL